jgi:hypothetical protein
MLNRTGSLSVTKTTGMVEPAGFALGIFAPESS